MDVSEILDELTDHGFEDTSEGRKLAKINATLRDIESREVWPFLEKSVNLNFDGASPSPTNMPTDFRAVLWMQDNVNNLTLWPEKLQTVRGRHSNQILQVGEPVLFYFLGYDLRLWPVPASSTGRFSLDYIATQGEVNAATLENAILLPPRHHDVIVLGTLWRLYKMEDDPENGGTFQQDYEAKLLQMREDLFRRQYVRADQIFVIDEDDEF